MRCCLEDSVKTPERIDLSTSAGVRFGATHIA